MDDQMDMGIKEYVLAQDSECVWAAGEGSGKNEQRDPIWPISMDHAIARVIWPPRQIKWTTFGRD